MFFSLIRTQSRFVFQIDLPFFALSLGIRVSPCSAQETWGPSQEVSATCIRSSVGLSGDYLGYNGLSRAFRATSDSTYRCGKGRYLCYSGNHAVLGMELGLMHGKHALSFLSCASTPRTFSFLLSLSSVTPTVFFFLKSRQLSCKMGHILCVSW